MPRQVSHIALQGGLDLVSSPLFIEPGRMWRCLNYEPVEGGYRRTAGYERFDGRPQALGRGVLDTGVRWDGHDRPRKRSDDHRRHERGNRGRAEDGRQHVRPRRSERRFRGRRDPDDRHAGDGGRRCQGNAPALGCGECRPRPRIPRSRCRAPAHDHPEGAGQRGDTRGLGLQERGLRHPRQCGRDRRRASQGDGHGLERSRPRAPDFLRRGVRGAHDRRDPYRRHLGATARLGHVVLDSGTLRRRGRRRHHVAHERHRHV